MDSYEDINQKLTTAETKTLKTSKAKLRILKQW